MSGGFTCLIMIFLGVFTVLLRFYLDYLDYLEK